ncbi:MAG: TIGR03936 family radical SAM-associated protein [Oscillospiraceae bacterium]|nr:TIGR03936 family radical SAM-associated protein [Oscillospiraceae bacterium]
MVRYILKLTKGEKIKFISHLDYLKAVQRIIKRSQIPVQYSEGFNPHMKCSFAMPLPVGIFSQGEYMDIYMQKEIDKKMTLKKLNENSDKNIEFLDIRLMDDLKIKKAMALVEACLYTIDLKISDSTFSSMELKKLMDDGNWMFSKKTKTKEEIIDLKEGIVELNYKIEDEYLRIVSLLKSGSKFNLSPQIVIEFLKDKLSSLDKDSFPIVERIEMYYEKDNSYIPIGLI